MANKDRKAPGAGGQESINKQKEEHAKLTEHGRKNIPSICSAVIAAMAFHEFEKAKELGCIPNTDDIMERLEARKTDFLLLVGFCATYLEAVGRAK